MVQFMGKRGKALRGFHMSLHFCFLGFPVLPGAFSCGAAFFPEKAGGCQRDLTFASAGAEGGLPPTGALMCGSGDGRGMSHVLVLLANVKPKPVFSKQLTLIWSCCVIPLDLFLLEEII